MAHALHAARGRVHATLHHCRDVTFLPEVSQRTKSTLRPSTRSVAWLLSKLVGTYSCKKQGRAEFRKRFHRTRRSAGRRRGCKFGMEGREKGMAKCFTGSAKPLWLWGYLLPRWTHKEREEVMGDQRRLAARARDARAHLLRDTHIKCELEGAMRNSPQFQAMGEVILVCWLYSEYKWNLLTRRKNPLVDEGGAMMYGGRAFKSETGLVSV